MKNKAKNIADMPDVMTVMDLAEVLRISKNTAYEVVHSKDFPCVIIGRQIRIPKERFTDWLKACGMTA